MRTEGPTGSFLSLTGRPSRLLLVLFCAFAGILPVQGQKTEKKKKTETENAAAAQKTPSLRSEEELVIEGMKYMVRGETDRALAIFEELAGQAPQSAAAHYLLATAQIKLNKPEGIESAKRAYALDKSNVYFGKFLAENLATQKKYKEAAVVYEEILKIDPNNLQYNMELAAVYFFSDELEKAISAYDRLEKNIGVTEEISKEKQKLYLRQNKLDKAIDEAKKLIDSDPGESYYYVELAELYSANNMLDKATPVLQEALRINPDEAQAHLLLADIYRRNGETEKCNRELQLVFSNPNFDLSPKIMVMKGYLAMLKANDDRSDAIHLLKLLIETHPNEPNLYAWYGDLLVQTNQKQKARDSYAKAARLNGSTYEVWAALLQMDLELGDFDSLLVHSENALEVFPNQGVFWFFNGTANLVKKSYQEAVSALEESKKLVNSNPTMQKHIYAQLGDAYNGVKAHEKSDEAYEFVLKADPENDHVLNNYSYFLSLRKEKLDKANEMSAKLVKKYPGNATYLDTHAWVLYMQKDYQGAKAYLEKALQDPKNISATILEHYGDVLSKLGERDRAIQQWKKAREMGEKSANIDKKIASGTVYD